MIIDFNNLKMQEKTEKVIAAINSAYYSYFDFVLKKIFSEIIKYECGKASDG